MTDKNWFDKALRLYARGLGYKKIAKELGINVKTVEARFANFKKKKRLKIGVRVDIPETQNKTFEQSYESAFGKSEDNMPKQETVEIHSNGSQTSSKLLKMNEQQKKSPVFLLEAHGYDSKQWMILSSKSSIWNMNSKENGIQDLYSSKITVKPLTEGIVLEDIEKHFNNYKPTFIGVEHKKINNNRIFELPIMDAHIGKFSYAPESGENFDHKILKERFNQVIQDVLSEINNQKFEYILLPIGQDLLNADNIEGNTSGGTPQDNDIRWSKMFNLTVELLVDLISNLQRIAPVKILLVPGNHSKMAEFYTIRYLEAYFRNCKTIEFDSRPIRRKYVEYGNSLIGFSHGDTEKKRIEGLMQIEAKESWGRTIYREFHLGHLHSEQTRELNGIIIRNISSITSTDAWHYNSGFVGAIKKLQSFIWDKEYGLIKILNFVVKE